MLGVGYDKGQVNRTTTFLFHQSLNEPLAILDPCTKLSPLNIPISVLFAARLVFSGPHPPPLEHQGLLPKLIQRLIPRISQASFRLIPMTIALSLTQIFDPTTNRLFLYQFLLFVSLCRPLEPSKAVTFHALSPTNHITS